MRHDPDPVQGRQATDQKIPIARKDGEPSPFQGKVPPGRSLHTVSMRIRQSGNTSRLS